MSIRFNRLAFAAAALGLAIAGSAVATSSAEASPLNGGRGGWGHHGHGGHGGGWRHHGHGGHGGGWGNGHCRPIRLCNPGPYGGGWGGGYGGGWGGTVVVGNSLPYGGRCRLVERENRWGEVVVRRVCRPAHWR